jgi:D-alanyl-D-alanine dipeptidase
MRTLMVLLYVMVAFGSRAQEVTSYEKNLNVVRQPELYLETVVSDPKNILVDLETEIPGIVLDIRYATSHNFTGEQIYSSPKAFVRKPVADALKKVQRSLSKKGVGLKIYDAYRPYAATVKFYEVYHDTTFVASPYSGSRHNRGAAVDVSLVDLKTGKELDMPTAFDSFSDTASPSFPDVSKTEKLNRTLLIGLMEANGFTVYPSEWWHFDYQGWNTYDVMDLSFEQLEKINSKLK